MNNIQKVNMSDEMKRSYIDYAMEVIVKRALPDVRDGLKPVLRRILFGMMDLKIYPNSPYKKCARIVGEVLGKYHPHGDSSVYEALVRMAQDFSLRYPLIDGHGNFGSIDGDSAAAMRYTESRLQKIALELTRDIDKNTVDFIPNFDGEEKEPVVLPAKFPNLLVNGTTGIAVGFASNMPPHNLTEVINAIQYRLKNENCTLDEIMQFIKAPDFPTGALIINPQDMKKIYELGNGKVVMRAKHHIENLKYKNKEIEAIVVTEIPYQINKAKLVEKIDELSKEQEKVEKGRKIKIKAKIPEIVEVRDESDREGIRIVIELKNKGSYERVLQLLYKESNLQCNFGVNNVALVNGLPVDNISLISLIDYYIEHQKEVITKKALFEKKKYTNQLHILDGIIIALERMDYTIKLIRDSKTKADAKSILKQELKIDDKQSDAILQMQLQRLTNLEKNNIIKQATELNEKIKSLNNILNNKNDLIKELIKDLEEIKNKFGDKRRTQLIEGKIINQDLLIEDYNTIIQLTNEGYIKKLRATSVKSTNKNRLKENDFIIREIKGTNKDTLLLFSNMGNVYRIKANQLKELKPGELGELISAYYELAKDEKIINIISTQFTKDEYMISIFANGKIAKVKMDSFKLSTRIFKYHHENIVAMSNIIKDKDVFLLSNEGKGLIFNTERINAKGSRNTQGNIGIKLNEGFKCISAIIDVNKEDRFTLHTQKDKKKFIMLEDISPKPETDWFTYLYGRNGNGGNFVYNTRSNNDLITDTYKGVE